MSYNDHQQHPPLGVPPPQGYPAKDPHPPPGYTAQGYPPPGYLQQGHAPQYVQQPLRPTQGVGFLEGWYVSLTLFS
ncbi:hypothetical protein VNO77_25151 [Canavalia gladiata]|uniref:Cysteine-rich and transmembrane domain-containing protein 1 n=1 Tax=Canavalia gladiata TaxID=3824 RepID=A0AAN9L7M2_CANGL